MKTKNKKIKNNKPKGFLKAFFTELFAGLIIVLFFLSLLVIGWILLSLFSENLLDILPVELIVLLGFFVFLSILYLISKTINLIRKIKTRSIKTQNCNFQENKEMRE